MPSLFTRIINGEIPSIKVHEDERTLAIMDINPIQTGQILVIPKTEAATVWDLGTSDYQALMDTVRQAGRKIRQQFPKKHKVGVIIEGLEMSDHAHVKIFPFNTPDEFHHLPVAGAVSSQDNLQALADKLSF